MTNDLDDIFDEADAGSQRMHALLTEPSVMQIVANSFDRVFYTDAQGTRKLEGVFGSPHQFVKWINRLMRLTDVGYDDIDAAKTSVIEGSFRPDLIDVHGSIHICTREITRGDPAVTIRKQPKGVVTLDQMLAQRMLNEEMRLFLEAAMRGRSNILISGSSGAGKTTMARALSWFIDPAHRVLTCEEIDELHIGDRRPNVVSLTTYRLRNGDGQLVRETTLDNLVREGLRMRPDRIWVGETRGQEAYALVKACNSGHDGSVTTVHADDGQQAVKQLVTYVMEAGVTEEVAREQVARAFHLVVQISKIRMDRRVVSEITELEPVREGTEQRRNPLYRYNIDTDSFERVSQPSKRLLQAWERYGVNYHDVNPWGHTG